MKFLAQGIRRQTYLQPPRIWQHKRPQRDAHCPRKDGVSPQALAQITELGMRQLDRKQQERGGI